jgi:hypothetical protein
MPCAYRRDRRPPADPARTGCQFGVPDNALISFAGKDWCPFHLPLEVGGIESGKRGWDEDAVQALSNAILAFVNRARAAGEPADLYGLVHPGGAAGFDGLADFDAALPPLLFDDAYFAGDADFIEVRFSGPVSFAGAMFEGDADFIVADFAEDADFSGARFKAGFDAAEARFHGKASFVGAVFEGPAVFRETQFAEMPDFSGARFLAPPIFERAVGPEGRAINPTA